jgi:hypothetical protein
MTITLQNLFATALLLLPLAASSAVSPVSVRVEQISKTETGKNDRTQHRSLKIILNNGSTEEKPNLVVKYWIFGKAVTGGDVVVLDKGERPGSVKAHASAIVETSAVTAHSVEAHTEKKKKVEASGEKIVGYAVQVFDGETMLGEAYEPLSLKEQIAKAGSNPAAGASESDKKKK